MIRSIPKMGNILPIMGMLFFLQPVFAADNKLKQEGLLESIALECDNLSDEAKYIQQIRADDHVDLKQIIINLQAYIADEFPHGQKKQPIWINRIKMVGKWVYYYPEDFDPVLVGNTYKVQCLEKSLTQAKTLFPKLFGSKEDQAKRAWESNRPEAEF